MQEIVKVPFKSGHIEAIKEGDSVHVIPKRICEMLGIDWDSQRKKLAAAHWATTAIMTVVANDGKTRDVTCLDHNCLPMWMASINTSKVKPELRDFLKAMQIEARDALADHFFGRREREPINMAEILATFATTMATTIGASVREAVQAAMTSERQAFHTERTTVGRSGASHICRALKQIAIINAGCDKRACRAELSSLHTDLRAELEFSGTGSEWANLPLHKWPAAKQALERMGRTAARTANGRQLSLVC